MLNYLRQFFQRQFADPQKVILVLVFGSLTVAFLLLGKIFAPILAALILAYLLVNNLISSLRIETLEWSDTAIAISLGVLSNIPGLVVYLVLVPFTVFFLHVLTLPVGLIAYFQWGWGIELFYTLLAYLVIQLLDGNVLFPLLFSRVVDLHPVAIIAALLFFGSIWGFWGIFFSIPLATVVKAVINAWMTATEAEPPAALQKTA